MGVNTILPLGVSGGVKERELVLIGDRWPEGCAHLLSYQNFMGNLSVSITHGLSFCTFFRAHTLPSRAPLPLQSFITSLAEGAFAPPTCSTSPHTHWTWLSAGLWPPPTGRLWFCNCITCPETPPFCTQSTWMPCNIVPNLSILPFLYFRICNGISLVSPLLKDLLSGCWCDCASPLLFLRWPHTYHGSLGLCLSLQCPIASHLTAPSDLT